MGDFRAKISVDVDMKGLDKLKSTIESIKDKSIKINLDIDKAAVEAINKLKPKDIRTKIVVDNSNIKAAQKDLVNLQKISASIQAKQGQLATLQASPKTDTASINKLQSELKELDADWKKVQASLNENLTVKTDGASTALDGLNKDATKLTKSYKNLDIAQQEIFENKRSTSANRDEVFLNNNIRLSEEYKTQLKDIIALKRESNSDVDLKVLNSRADEIKSAARAAGETGSGKTMSQQFDEVNKSIKGNIVGIGKLAASYLTLQAGIRMAKSMAKEVLAVDSAMTDLYKVTDASKDQYGKFFENSKKDAVSLGRSVSGLITQSAEWAKTGFSLNESQDLARVSTIYANVGDVDDKTAVQDLTAIMKAYNIESNNSIGIVDQLNNLSNKYAVSAAGLGAGLKDVASVAALAGTSMEKTNALLVGGSEITQAPEEMGKGLRTVMLRLRGMTGALQDLGEESEGIESVSKMQTQILNLTKGKVNIFDKDDPNKFRDVYDILQDISAVYGDLKETEQAELLELVSGKMRANQTAAIISAFQNGQIDKIYQDALTSDGSAQAEQDTWMNSLEAKLASLQAQWQAFSTTFVNTDMFKGLIDGATSLLGILTSIAGLGGGAGSLGLLGAIFGTGSFLKNMD